MTELGLFQPPLSCSLFVYLILRGGEFLAETAREIFRKGGFLRSMTIILLRAKTKARTSLKKPLVRLRSGRPL